MFNELSILKVRLLLILMHCTLNFFEMAKCNHMENCAYVGVWKSGSYKKNITIKSQVRLTIDKCQYS